MRTKTSLGATPNTRKENPEDDLSQRDKSGGPQAHRESTLQSSFDGENEGTDPHAPSKDIKSYANDENNHEQRVGDAFGDNAMDVMLESTQYTNDLVDVPEPSLPSGVGAAMVLGAAAVAASLCMPATHNDGTDVGDAERAAAAAEKRVRESNQRGIGDIAKVQRM